MKNHPTVNVSGSKITSVNAKKGVRDEMARQTAEYLVKGNVIEVIKSDAIGRQASPVDCFRNKGLAV